MLKTRGKMIAQALSGEDSGQVTVNIATMRKDVRAMLEQGARLNVKLPLTALALQSFDQAASEGLDAKDCTRVPVWWLEEGGRG